MPFHPDIADRLPLLDGIPSLEAGLSDPSMRAQMEAFDDVVAATRWVREDMMELGITSLSLGGASAGANLAAAAALRLRVRTTGCRTSLCWCIR